MLMEVLGLNIVLVVIFVVKLRVLCVPLFVMSIDEVMTFFEVATLMVSLFGVSLAVMGWGVDGVVAVAVADLICMTMLIRTVVFNRKMFRKALVMLT